MNQRLILVVDDERSIRESIVELLDVEGYDCLTANNGEEAFSVLEQSERVPDVILLDQMMPKVTGEQFLVALRNFPEYLLVSVILVSAAQDAQKIANSFGVDFVRKPLDADLLLKAIERNF